MSGTLTNDKAAKPDPTFLPENAFLMDEKSSKETAGDAHTRWTEAEWRELKEKLAQLQKKAGQATDNTNRKALTPKELTAMFDAVYENETPKQASRSVEPDHARRAGSRMVRNLSLAASAALLLGFSLGLYSLANEGADTSLGKSFNRLVASVKSMELFSQAGAGQNGTTTKTKIASGSAEKKIRALDAPSKDKSAEAASLKPIKTASLVVSDVSGIIKAGIPLKLSLKGAAPRASVSIKVMNVPADAVLTAGKRNGKGVWTLKAAELENLSLVLSSSRQSPIMLDVELIEARTGQLLTPPRRINVAVIDVPPLPTAAE